MNNKWTVALAALGVVSIASVAQAEEKASQALTSLSSTTISGYVDTSAHWNFGTGNANLPIYKFNSASKADGFNLNVVQVSLDKPLDESEWASGYHVDMWAGPDAKALGTSSFGGGGDVAIRQAYVALRAPLGTGLNLKMGVFDSILGYESVEAGKNPNYTRSFGNTLDPQTHTGLLASYRFCEVFSASAGVANTTGPQINTRPDSSRAESYKTYMGSVAMTAPESMGFLKGSTVYAGAVSGFNNSIPTTSVDMAAQSYYLGATIATPVDGLRFGAAYDLLVANTLAASTHQKRDDSALAGYVSFQATEKLSLHGRFDWARIDQDLPTPTTDVSLYATTATVQYELWANVLSRLEFRWDHADHGKVYGDSGISSSSITPDRANAFLLALNVIYKF
jgi:hypothetical protein